MRQSGRLGPYIFTNAALVGLFASAGVYHLALWWAGRRDLVLLLFAARSLVASVFGVVFVLLATAPDVATAARYSSLRITLMTLALPLGAWTLSLVSGVRARPYLWFTTVVMVSASVLSLLFPVTATVLGIERLTLPWGETISVTVRGPSPVWVAPLYVLGISVDVFGTWCAFRLWSRDRIGGALVGMASLGGITADIVAARVDVASARLAYVGIAPWALWLVLIALQTARSQRERDRQGDEDNRLNRQRQADLEDQLRQSQKLETLGRLAGGIAHDFNNLLTVINGRADLLVEQLSGDSATRRDAQQIREAGQRAGALTRQLLAFSRQSVVDVTVVSLNESVTAAEGILRRIIGEDIHFSVLLSAAEPCVKADPGQLGEILLNLAANARDAMPRGGRLIFAVGEVAPSQMRLSGHTGSWAVLRVSDTGTGMSPEVRARIFEPFFTTKETGRGTGLGLSVVHGIVSQNGGRIEVESAIDGGTVVTVYLPAAERPAHAPPGIVPTPVLLGTETVLLVEDDAAVRRVLVGMLERLGYQVLGAESGADAQRIVDGHDGPIDLLITDVLMPGMTGPELVRAAQTRRPRLAVIFISGYAPDSVRLDGATSTPALFLAKPFSAPMLGAKFREALELTRASLVS